MSALGVGLLAGCFASGLVIPRAFRGQDASNLGCVTFAIAGVVAPLVVPAVFGGFADFLIGALAPAALLIAARWRAIKAIALERQAERDSAESQRQERELRRAEAKKAEVAWVADYSEKGWEHVSRAKLMHVRGQPDCVVMISANEQLLQFCPFKTSEDFTPEAPIVLNVNQVLGLNIAKPTITKTREKVVPVSIVENKRKSPVTRGIVGGALLGPAGVVLGAASGLNSKTSTKIEERKVTEQYESEGDPQLIIGTSNPEAPVLKIQFEPAALADQWLFRIQGVQQRVRRRP